MSRIQYIIFVIIMAFPGCKTERSEIRLAVEKQLELYPESTLQDIYKSFFQDEYGPGHLLENVSFAREYFDLELEEMESKGRHEAETCGAGKNFIRVPMDLVKDGIIPEDAYFNAFVESSAGFTIPDLMVWRKEWERIFNEIKTMNLKISNLERDNQEILRMIYHGNAMVHHSDPYIDAYDPHYRIMSKEQWERLSSIIQR